MFCSFVLRSQQNLVGDSVATVGVGDTDMKLGMHVYSRYSLKTGVERELGDFSGSSVLRSLRMRRPLASWLM